MEDRHVLIHAKTGLVTNIIIWKGKEWLPPRDHYVIHNADGEIGDYWHQDTNTFYTPDKKRRYKDAMGKAGSIDLTSEESSVISERLDQIYTYAKRVFNMDFRPDLTLLDNPVPKN